MAVTTLLAGACPTRSVRQPPPGPNGGPDRNATIDAPGRLGISAV